MLLTPASKRQLVTLHLLSRHAVPLLSYPPYDHQHTKILRYNLQANSHSRGQKAEQALEDDQQGQES